jgi:hypothetical protein
MKVNIWVHKSDVINNKITNYYTHGIPQTSNWPDYVQIQITQDEFARLEDKTSEPKNNVIFESELEETGRSTMNYTYPEFVANHYKEKDHAKEKKIK